MKKHYTICTAILSAAFLFALPAKAQSGGREPEKSWDLKNSITLSLSTFNTISYGSTGFLPVSLEFDRYFTDRFSWGVNLSYSKTMFALATDSYELDESFLLLSGKISYSLLLTENKSCLKFGLGLGVGYHSDMSVSFGMIPPPGYNHSSDVQVSNRILPHLLVDINWVIRVSRSVELRLAPLILSPSRLIYTPFGFNEPYNESYFNFDWFVKIAVGIRF